MYPLTSEDYEAEENLAGYSPDEIENLALEHIEDALFNNGYAQSDFKITAVRCIGSRISGTCRPDSDLDVLVIYEGDIRDDDFFSMVNERPMWIEDIQVDMFPEKERSLNKMLELDARYQLEKIYHMKREYSHFSAVSTAQVGDESVH